MTNSRLRDFGSFLHDELKISPRGHTYTVEEGGSKSYIKALHLGFKNNHDVIVLRHDLEKLESINPVLRYPFKDKELQDFSNFLCKDLKISPKALHGLSKKPVKTAGLKTCV